MQKLKTSLKTKIVFLTGTVFVTLLLIISVTLLFQWKAIIIQKEISSNLAVTNTFSVSAIDALIYQEQTELQKENVLEIYVDNFINRIENVKYVVIYDASDLLILSRERNSGSNAYGDNLSAVKPSTNNELCSIFHNKQFGWIMEIDIPLKIAGKTWGYAKIGYDVESVRNEIKEVFFLLFGSTIIISFLSLIALYFLAHRLTLSLNDLVFEIDNINILSDTEPTDTAEPSQKAAQQNDEIGFLFRRFNKMKKRIENSKTELENAQRQIYQAEKLASIGRLASGVAHQVNNPLNGIKSCIYAIQREPENTKQTAEYLDLINEGLNNIETVVQKLLGFARQQHDHKTKIDINESVIKIINLFDYRIKDKMIELVTDLDNSIPEIEFDYYLFQEVVMNLLLNSFDAVASGGKIEISTSLNNEQNIIIKIKDNGEGIEKENLKKIFDPFFTTKDPGIGTGLGLAVCQNIIESYGGKIEVTSITEETIFRVILPVKEKDENTNN